MLSLIMTCMMTLGFKGHIYVRISVGIGASRYGANHIIHNHWLPIASVVKDIQEAICCMQLSCHKCSPADLVPLGLKQQRHTCQISSALPD